MSGWWLLVVVRGQKKRQHREAELKTNVQFIVMQPISKPGLRQES